MHFLRPWNGNTIRNGSEEEMRTAIDGLRDADAEHPEVSLKHASGWTLSYFSSGRLTWEDVGADGPARHMANVLPDRVLLLWKKLAAGDLSAIETEPWQPGY